MSTNKKYTPEFKKTIVNLLSFREKLFPNQHRIRHINQCSISYDGMIQSLADKFHRPHHHLTNTLTKNLTLYPA